MQDRNTEALKCNNKTYIATIPDGELLNKLRWLKQDYLEQKIRLSICSITERSQTQKLIENLEVCYNETKELLEELVLICT